MSIYDIVEEMSKEEQSDVPRKRNVTNSSNQDSKRQKIMTFKVEKIGFNFKDENNKDLMVFKLYALNFQQHQQNKISNKSITIEKLDSLDYLYKYKDPKLQTLISAKDIGLKVQRNKNEEQKKFEVELIFPDIYINWKPDVLVIFMKLVYSYISKDVKHRVDDGQVKTR